MQSPSPQRRIGTLSFRWMKNKKIKNKRKELAFWRSCAKHFNSKTVNDKPTKKSNFIVYSDASASGCGAHLDFGNWVRARRVTRGGSYQQSTKHLSHSCLLKGRTWNGVRTVRQPSELFKSEVWKKGLHDLAIKIFSMLCRKPNQLGYSMDSTVGPSKGGLHKSNNSGHWRLADH